MKKHIVVASLFLSLFLPCSSWAWVFIDGVTITRLIQFERGIYRDYAVVEFSGESTKCRIPYDDKELLSVTLAAHFANQTVSVVCYDLEDDPGSSGYPSHKLHRLNTN